MHCDNLGARFQNLYDRAMKPAGRERERLLWALLATAVFGLLAGGYAYFNQYPIHDGIGFFARTDHVYQTQLGRFLIPPLMKVKGAFAMPLVTGLAALLFLWLSAYSVSVVLGQRSRLEIALTCGFLAVNPFMLEINSAFQFFADIFLGSLLLACLGVLCLYRKVSMKRAALSFLLFFLSFGLYPAHASFAVCLYVLTVVRSMMQGDKSWRERAWVWIAVLASAAATYLIVSRLTINAGNLRVPNTYNSIHNLNALLDKPFLETIRTHYRAYWQIFFDGGEYAGRATGLAAMGLGIMAVFAAALAFPRKRALVALVVLAMLFPLGSRVNNIIMGKTTIHRTMFAQYLTLPILAWLTLRGAAALGKRRRRVPPSPPLQRFRRLSSAAMCCMSTPAIPCSAFSMSGRYTTAGGSLRTCRTIKEAWKTPRFCSSAILKCSPAPRWRMR